MRRWLLWIFVLPFSACTQRTSFPDPLSNIAGAKKPLRPAVVIRRARLLSALGSSCEDTLRQLASAEDLCAELAPSDVRVPESDLAEADRRIAEAARTTGLKAFTRPARSLRLAASAALPLLDEALQAGIAPADIGLIVGNTAAGTAETVSVLRSHPETEAPDKWMPIEIGAVAALTARLAGISGPAYCVSTACTAGSKAILEGARLLLTGRVRAVVAGGIDAESPLTEAGFSALGARSPGRALPFDARRTGMHLGEGGGFLLMMLAQTEQAYFGGMPDEGPEVRLAGWGETSDAHHICAPAPGRRRRSCGHRSGYPQWCAAPCRLCPFARHRYSAKRCHGSKSHDVCRSRRIRSQPQTPCRSSVGRCRRL